jgi:hypothetical protein
MNTYKLYYYSAVVDIEGNLIQWILCLFPAVVFHMQLVFPATARSSFYTPTYFGYAL